MNRRAAILALLALPLGQLIKTRKHRPVPFVTRGDIGYCTSLSTWGRLKIGKPGRYLRYMGNDAPFPVIWEEQSNDEGHES